MNPPGKVYVLTCWEREGQATEEIRRARLLDVLEAAARRLAAGAPLRLAFGETALLAEVAALRPDLSALLTVYNAADRLSIGPWYVPPAAALVSGEALVRNLLAARADAEQYEVRLARAAYLPAAVGYPAQLPALLLDFGMDALLAEASPAPAPLRWSGPDARYVLVLSLNGQRETSANGLTLHLQAVSAPEASGEYITLDDYIAALRRAVPDPTRPVISGELYPPTDAASDTGRLSARLPIKQTVLQLQQQLTYAVEPWLALALTHSQPVNADNLRALLKHNWRLLLLNQTPDALGGTASDAVHDEHELRARQAADVSAYLVEQARCALVGQPSAPRPSETYVVVWNPHNWAAQQPVSLRLAVAENQQVTRLLDAGGREIPFAWDGGTLQFVADAPPVGYTTYTVHLNAGVLPPEGGARTPGMSITNALGDEKLLVSDDRLIWRHIQPSLIDRNGQVIRESQESERAVDLLRFFDGGDAGDTFQYRAPQPDLVVPATLLPNVEVESTRLYQRLILRHRFRLTPALDAQRGRARGVKSLDLLTTVTLYQHLPGVYFETTFENTVKDHRLRAHLRTGLTAAHVLADSAFGLVSRAVSGEAGGAQALQTLCAVDDGSSALALLSRGLPEYQTLREQDQITLALTLLRAVGWQRYAAQRAAPAAQCLRTMTAEYALRPVPPGDPAALLRAGQSFSAPLQAHQQAQRPAQPTRGFLNLDVDGLILTALKPPEAGHGWIVRLLNPGAHPLAATLYTLPGLKTAQVVSLAEELRADLPVQDGSAVKFQIGAQQMLTLRLGFGG
jgi:alpha-mannosidase/mannosylglycerate hydrolase